LISLKLYFNDFGQSSLREFHKLAKKLEKVATYWDFTTYVVDNEIQMAQVDNNIKYDVSVSKAYFCWWSSLTYFINKRCLWKRFQRSSNIVLFKILFDFGDLARYHITVRVFVSVFIKVVLMVILSNPKLLKRQQTSSYFNAIFLLKTLDHFLSNLFLELISVKNGWKISCTYVVPLTICLSRIVSDEKYLKDF